MTMLRLGTGILLVVVLTDCMATRAANPALIEARQIYAEASADPLAARNAPLELKRAEEALRRAEAAYANGAVDVSHLAYMASRQAQVAREAGALKEARNIVATTDLTHGSAALQAHDAELERLLAEIQAERTERGLVMTLGDVLFAPARAELTPSAEVRVARLAAFMQRYPTRVVRVEGFTDNTGSPQGNLMLSDQRAMAVRDALVARGVSPDRIVSQGFGGTRPVADNTTEAGRLANRRVEVVISESGTVAETR
ncbi:MAG TPA: OmpA family protein [Azospirillum sp.]|nr:OmpA family protein [Azospirillum sp.]